MGVREEAAQVVPKTTETEVARLAGELIERHRSTAKYAPEFLHGKPYVVLRDKDGNERIEYVTGQVEQPTFRKGLVLLDDAPSFIEYFNRHMVEASAIYATINPCKFVGVLDEHPDKQARRCRVARVPRDLHAEAVGGVGHLDEEERAQERL
jgi:hypothetical protein